MNFKKIIIYQQDILFNILNEIKENFDFDIIKANKETFDEYKNNEKKEFLLITKIQKTIYKNQLIIDQTPIKIEKLIQQINLRFLKEKFKYQSDVSIGNYKLDLNSREISKQKNVLDLTEREINLILYLKNASSAVKIEKLQKEVWEHGSKLETHTVETHIYRLRKKIKEKFGDDNFIVSLKEGYFIN